MCHDLVRTEQPSLDLPYPAGWLEEQGLIFTDQEIKALRETILIDALQSAVDGRCSRNVRNEMREWIEDDSIAPFSFRVCAIERGADPDKLRATYQRIFDYKATTASNTDNEVNAVEEEIHVRRRA